MSSRPAQPRARDSAAIYHSVAGPRTPRFPAVVGGSAFKRACKQAGVHKRAHVHSLRHSYATHLLESGVNLRLIQCYLGHGSPGTTAVYTHLTADVRDAARLPIDALMLPR